MTDYGWRPSWANTAEMDYTDPGAEWPQPTGEPISLELPELSRVGARAWSWARIWPLVAATVAITALALGMTVTLMWIWGLRQLSGG